MEQLPGSPTEDTPPVDEAGQAEAARQAAALRLQRAQTHGAGEAPAPPQEQEPSVAADPDRLFPSELDPNLAGEEAGLHERFRLNRLDSFYRSTLTGSARLQGMAAIASEPDPEDASSATKKFNAGIRDQYHGIISDLARYDLMAPWSSTAEAAVAFGGQLTGNMQSPESLIGEIPKFGLTGATMLARAGKSALTQGGIQLATDPVVQLGSISAGAQHEYEWMRTAAAPVVGAIIGGGLHIGGELLSNTTLKRIKADVASEDPQMRAADTAPEIQAPERVAEPAPTPEPTPTAAPEPAARASGAAGRQGGTAADELAIPARKPSAFAAMIAPEPKSAQPISVVLRADPDTGKISSFGAFTDTGAASAQQEVVIHRLWNEYIGNGPWPGPAEALKDLEANGIGHIADVHEVPIKLEQGKALPKKAFVLASMDDEGRTVIHAAFADANEAKRAQDRVLRRLWEQHGRELDYDDLPEKIWTDEVHAWNDKHGTHIDPDNYRFGNEPQFDAAFDAKHLAGKKQKYPGAKAAVEYFREGDQPLYAVQLTGVSVGERGSPSQSGNLALMGGSSEQALAQRRGGSSLSMERARPEAGVPSDQATTGTAVSTLPNAASPQQQTAIRSLQQMSMDLADAIGFPLREGRVTVRKALGIYKPGSGVVRVKEVPDFEVVAHEAGHAIEAKVGENLTALTEAASSELKPLDYDQTKQRVNEGFAEWIRLYIGDQANAQQIAPVFSVAFREFMSKEHPDILKALDNTAAAYRAYNNASSIDVVGASIVRRTPDSGFSAVAQKIREDGFSPTIKLAMRRFYDMLWNDKADVVRVVREMGRAAKENQGGGLVDLKHAADPAVLIRSFERSGQAAIMQWESGVVPYRGTVPEGPALNNAVAKMVGEPPIMGRWDEGKLHLAETYLIARQAIERWGQFERKEIPNPPTGFPKGDAVVAAAELERMNPSMREGAEMYVQFHRNMLRKAFESGSSGLEKDVYDRLIAQPFYAPMWRDLSDKPLMNDGNARASSVASAGTSDLIKKFSGSSRDILSPLQSTMTQTLMLEKKIAHNEIMRSLEDLSTAAGSKGGVFFERLPAHEAKKYNFDLSDTLHRKALERGMSPDDAKLMVAGVADMVGEDPMMGSFFRMERAGGRGEPIVFYQARDGRQAVSRVIPKSEGYALYEALTALPNQTRDLATSLMSLGSHILVKGVTTNPAYLVYNWLRDQLVATKFIRGYIPLYHGIKGTYDVLVDGEMSRLRAYSGGVSGGTAVTTFEAAQKADINALAKSGWTAKRFTSWNGFLDFLGTSEAGTRTAVFGLIYKEGKRQGLSDYEAVQKAKFESDDLLDFGVHGSHMDQARKITPFVQSNLTGLDKARRQLITPLRRWLSGDMVFTRDKEELANAVRSWVKTMAIPIPLGFTWAALNWEKDSYRDAKPDIKGRHYMTQVGDTAIVLPKEFELSLGFTLGEYAYAAMMQNDPRSLAYFGSATKAALNVPVPFLDNPMLKTLIGNLTGTNIYSYLPFESRPIIPGYLEGIAPKYQVIPDRTTSWAKKIGAAIGMSPIKVDYTVGGLFGSWGRDILALSQAMEPDTPEMKWSEMAIIKRGAKDPLSVTDVPTRFWDYLGGKAGKFNEGKKTYDFLVKNRRDEEAREYLRSQPQSVRDWVTLESGANEDGKAAFKADEKRLHPMRRAYDAVTVLNGIAKELAENSFKSIATGTPTEFSKREKALLLDRRRELGQMEMVNALIITNEPGYAGRPLHDVSVPLEKIRSISPEVANEIKTRYATERIYKTEAVADAYPKMQAALMQAGSQADLRDLAADAKADGYEFGGQKAKKPPKRRLEIAPSPQP